MDSRTTKLRNPWLAVVSVLGLVLAGCATTEPGDSPGAESPGGGEPEQTEDAGTGFTPEDVEIVVHSGPGGGNDTLARAMAQMLVDEGLADTLYPVSNREGGSGAAAMAYMAEQAGDPNTWGVHTMVWVSTPLRLGGDAITIDQMTPIAQLVEERSVLAVRADSDFEDLQSILDAAEEGQVVQVGGSIGALDHVNGLLLANAAEVEFDFLSFPGGGERTSALLGGDADFQIEGARDFVELSESGDVRVLGAFSEERNPLFPDVPTVTEATGLDLNIVVEQRGVTGPPDMPEDAVAYWEDIMRQMMETEAWAEFSEASGFTDDFGDSEVWGQTLTENQETLRTVFDEIGLLGTGEVED